ncbi:polysaccharide deacetylase family protein [Pontibacter korlensis]|uniref:polysaccharide deacetylase family protein n=1 Tax=Pontibacter korlensis TaxID=400092 RepID=UPI000696362F|nr:polysaccharide deacetylase family protein [Pontibacter korlensis]
MKLTIRNMLGLLFAYILIWSGFVRRALNKALQGDYVLSIYFHKPTRREFEASIRWLQKNNFNFLSTADLEKIVLQESPFPKGAVVITVDDGWQSNEDCIAEVAKKYKVPVTIFVSTGPVEEGVYWWSYAQEARRRNIKCLSLKALKKLPNKSRLEEIAEIKNLIYLDREAMTIDQVKTVADSDYVSIGGHSHSHPILVNCSAEQVHSEMSVSKIKLESWLEKDISCFAYPNGDYGEREIRTLQRLGYRLAFCSEPRHLTPDVLDKCYQLPRFGFLEGASFAENTCRMVGVWQHTVQRFKKPSLKGLKAEFAPVPHTEASAIM